MFACGIVWSHPTIPWSMVRNMKRQNKFVWNDDEIQFSHYFPPTLSAFPCHENGATVLQYASKQQLLITGGRKGFVCVFDIRQRQLLHTFQAHDSAIKALALDAYEDFFVTGSSEGNMKVWQAQPLTHLACICFGFGILIMYCKLMFSNNYFGEKNLYFSQAKQLLWYGLWLCTFSICFSLMNRLSSHILE